MEPGASGMVRESANCVVVGAGFGGMHAVHRLHEQGLGVIGIDGANEVGGLWYWNRYPSVPCDEMTIDYSYSFSDGIQQDWTLAEQFCAHPEILAYANFVASKLALHPRYRSNARLVSARWQE